MLTLEQDLSLDALLANAWRSLEEGARNRKHVFHLGVVATVRGDAPSVRTVVLRKAIAETRTLVFHSDKRSEKIAELRANPNVSWLFYDPNLRVQLRLAGVATLHFDDELADLQWKNSKLTSRRCYISLPPLTKLDKAASGLPEWLLHRIPTLEESEAGRENFAVVETRIHSLDWLWLNSTGHRRARFVWRDGELDASWVAP
ncbi:MAG: pyridoxamine 5'-phosphate oxidase family protein [Chloroherpetonaceae bacterium]|nr:pyridoxamine 5'-phosphate oxidase family protein [Chloroherpetonaceae bacterium]MDW8437400.1 pyridoxamine 5'-phosphate oxidase family protein [Chloroherpetonaceae bacterium]